MRGQGRGHLTPIRSDTSRGRSRVPPLPLGLYFFQLDYENRLWRPAAVGCRRAHLARRFPVLQQLDVVHAAQLRAEELAVN